MPVPRILSYQAFWIPRETIAAVVEAPMRTGVRHESIWSKQWYPTVTTTWAITSTNSSKPVTTDL
ncbi:hypothetical protein AK37_19668 [Rhodococcus pyridinivorans AK37]|uniref:Uncharacterized protein n=1 Tax=Rhodococcus pyridinivorans AK37 TaxID=1114960 RepID=H0JW61_9NOCA|nr:hypothetical protein BO226_01820 [Rhodococcus sp. 2G]EHK81612.1 hypothetical protein AK37_19668 [Rhodococcus pyridinivorans AK37]